MASTSVSVRSATALSLPFDIPYHLTLFIFCRLRARMITFAKKNKFPVTYWRTGTFISERVTEGIHNGPWL